MKKFMRAGVYKYALAMMMALCFLTFTLSSAIASTTYDFSNVEAASDGFKPQGNRFFVSSSFVNDPSHPTAIYYTSGASTVTGIIIKADGVNLLSFDLNNMGFIVDPAPQNITSLKITATRSVGDPVSVTLAPGDLDSFTLSALGADLSAFTNVTQLQFDVTMNKVLSLDFATITISNEVHSPPTISKTFGATSIPLNGSTPLTFTVGNPNTSATLSGVAFTDNLPAGLVVASAPNLSNTCGGSVTAVAGSSSLTLSGASLTSSSSCTVSVDVKGTTPGQKDNSVTVTYANAVNSASASITVVEAAADLALLKTASSTAIPQNELIYTITLTNNGPSDALNVNVIDTLPANTTFKSVSMGGGSGWQITTPSVGGVGTVSCAKSSVASGETSIFLLSVQVGTGAANNSTISNTATVSTSTNDPNSANNTSTASSTVSYPVRAKLPEITYFPTLTAACANASSPNTIDARGIEFAESLRFNQGKTLTIKGGYDSGFLSNSGRTTVGHPLIVNNGKLILDRVAVK